MKREHSAHVKKKQTNTQTMASESPYCNFKVLSGFIQIAFSSYFKALKYLAKIIGKLMDSKTVRNILQKIIRKLMTSMLLGENGKKISENFDHQDLANKIGKK